MMYLQARFNNINIGIHSESNSGSEQGFHGN